ncbi:MAG: hypothetical protein L6Q95_06315 [Planctomycetes bacterium]|nr:hypothetical protein [Planctomycetota bacterium]
MQDELLTENPATIIRLLGCNQVGAEGANPTVTAGRDIPWTQDTAAQHVWTQWRVVYRDVIILDVNNVPVGVFNLTVNNLADPVHYATLKAMLKAAAGE